MDQNNNNFMDSRTLWAILLVGVVWFGWQQYVNKKYGNQIIASPEESIKATNKAINLSNSNISKSTIDEKINTSPEKIFNFSTSNIQGDLSSKGMSLKNVSLIKFKNKDGLPIQFSGGKDGLFSTTSSDQKIDFEISQLSQNEFIGKAIFNNISLIKKIVFLDDYKINIETKIEAISGFIPPIEISIEDDMKKTEAGSIFSPANETQDLLVLNSDGNKEFNTSKEKDGFFATINQATLAGISTHYFSAAFLDKSEISPNFVVNQKPLDSFLKGILAYKVGSERKSFITKGVAYIGPKDIKILESVDPLLLKVVKFGFFSAIAKPLLITMKWFFSLVGNWGWSIILLTLLVRIIVMPFHLMSFRSMKAMQKVQPMIQALREKLKDDPLTLNKEMMLLMKKNKVNPMGGCLPMLLQIPVFFALYRVFSESIELYQSPFIFWIHDLSIKDPYFVLPVLMASVMYLQQKITPSTMDPAQAKVMQFMPLIFSFMMISLPSALTLYMFVSTFFGILQQYLFLRDKPSVLAVNKPI